MEIQEKVLDYGSRFQSIKRTIEYNNGHDENMLMVDFDNGEAVGASFKFNGTLSCGGGSYKIEELRRFKALLNSFEEL
ncbi:hypothetical protein CPT_Merlin108 [Citrobacter phage Merlin]|uniref:Uncharacterized protein n=1 Tax=Citrobacter phage Merlin TaxID=1675602 RepID=A0A0K1LMP8_9CAUD|nr:hypothetical protein CPT_Merlin108 [Citrobacter phage Merlin]AKU43754.1 hypothetical protein CPT_Merlin108 [Citrobacter phage Merlin]